MYNRVGRCLFTFGRQLKQKLGENTRNNVNGEIFRIRNISLRDTPNIIFQRNYCDESNEETEEKILPADQEALIQLKEYFADSENKKMQKILELEIDIMRQNSQRVPDELKPRHWWELIQLQTLNKRRQYLEFLWSVEKQKAKQKAKKLEKRMLYEAGLNKNYSSLSQNSMFMRIYETTINQMYHNRLINRIMYGQKIVFDCSYDNLMTRAEMKNCAKQLQYSFSVNRLHDDPFDMYLCNIDSSSEVLKALNRFIPPLYDIDFPLNVKTESYLDIFDKDRLVYLTPHCTEEMTKFDHDAVYIIGAFVDKTSHEPASLAKAKKEGLKMMKLPLDRYLEWGQSSGKNLTINAVLSILLDYRLTGNWSKAFEHVPRRKLYEARVASEERRMKRRTRTESSIELMDAIKPLQIPKPKPTMFYNASTEISVNQRSNFQSSNNRDKLSNVQSNYNRQNDRDSFDVNRDFTMAGRANRFKRNSNN